MRTITVNDNFHWKAVQLHGDKWRCIKCDATHATNLVTWSDHLDTALFTFRYCKTCLPEILIEPPLEQRLKLPDRSEWELKSSSSESPCDICGSPVDIWEGLKGRFVLCPSHHNRRGYLTCWLRSLRTRATKRTDDQDDQ
jgi:hypothetical protein